MTGQLWPSVVKGGGALPPDAKGRMEAAVIECVPHDEMIGWNADLYAARFTAPELTELLAFYQTPTGGKLARALPAFMGEVGKKMGPIMMSRLPAGMKKQGFTQ